MNKRIILFILLLFQINLVGQERFLIKFESEINSIGSAELLLENSLNNNDYQSVIKEFKQFSLIKEFSNYFTFKSIKSLEEIKSKLHKTNEILKIEKLGNFKIDEIFTNDPGYENQWGLDKINITTAWEHETGDSNIVIGVVDTGLDFEHEDFVGRNFINFGEYGLDNLGNQKQYNNIDDDENGFVDDYIGWNFVNYSNNDIEHNNPIDDQGHGTIVSGVIGANSNNLIGISGINWKSKILVVKAFDSNGYGKEEEVSAALLYAYQMGAKLINMSFGDYTYSTLFQDVINYISDKGVVLIASSGNSSSDQAHYPSAFENVISVGSTDINDYLSSFSNYGNSLDLVAPGSEIYTTTLNNDYTTVSGTSLSAPFVSGVISLLLSQNPELSPNIILQILKSTAQDIYSTGIDYYSGAGRLDAEKAILSNEITELNIHYPRFNQAFRDTIFAINITAISSRFVSYNLTLLDEKNDSLNSLFGSIYQIIEGDIYEFNTNNLSDGKYFLRLTLNKNDGTKTSEFTQFQIIREKPELQWYLFSNSYVNGKPTITLHLGTNQETVGILNYNSSNAPVWNSVFMDNQSQNIGDLRTTHSITLKDNFNPNEVINFYTQFSNLANLNNRFPEDENMSFIIENYPLNKFYQPTEIQINGDIFKDILTINNKNYILYNQFDNYTSLNFDEITENYTLNRSITLEGRRIPKYLQDINSDGKLELISFVYPNLFIDSQHAPDSLSFNNILTTNLIENIISIGDFDNDSNLEILSTKNDSVIQISEINNNFDINIEAEFINRTPIISRDFYPNKIITNETDIYEGAAYLIDNEGDIIQIIANSANNYSAIMAGNFPILLQSANIKNDKNGHIFVQGILNNELFFQNQGILALYNLGEQLQLVDIKSFIDNDLSSKIDNNSLVLTDSTILSNIFGDYYELDRNSFEILNYNKNHIVNAPIKHMLASKLNGARLFSKPDENTPVQRIYIDNNSNFDIPNIIQSYSLDTNLVFFTINNPENKNVILERSVDFLNFSELFETNLSEFYDNTTHYGIFYYRLKTTDDDENEYFSSTKRVFVHPSTYVTDVEQESNNSILVKFSNKINFSQSLSHENYFNISGNNSPNSMISNTEKSIIVFFERPFYSNETINFYINNFRDFWNSPIEDTNFVFLADYINSDSVFMISNFDVNKTNNSIKISFNIPFETESVFNLSNYSVSPANEILNIDSLNDYTINITFKNQIGLGTKIYTIRLENIYSKNGIGPIAENASVINIISNEKDLSNEYVFPNPINATKNKSLSFVNLTPNCRISIFSINGKNIFKSENSQSPGYYIWNLKDKYNQEVPSGIYIYVIESLDENGEVIEIKTNKFAVVK